MELPYGMNPFAPSFSEHYEENKIQSPREDGREEGLQTPKQKRSKKMKASD